MRIAAHLGVKDEIELIDPCIRHLRTIGIDHIIACDVGSTDGTLEVLEQHHANGNFDILRLNNQMPARLWLEKNEEAARAVDADWIIFLDADEFWLPHSGSLKDCAALAAADLIYVHRYNIPVGPHGALMPKSLVPDRYDELMLLTESIPDFRKHMLGNPEFPWIRGMPSPKIMVRPQQIGQLTDGMHEMIPLGEQPLRRVLPNDLAIAHLPFTTWPRFARKLENIKEMFHYHDEYCGENIAWQWRRWLKSYSEGRAAEEFQRMRFDADTIAELRWQGVIRSADEILNERRRNPVTAAREMQPPKSVHHQGASTNPA